jgi:pseudaminic acid cytidylyltransferase
VSRTIAFIPARGGSVRIPRKNVRMFHGKPIIAYSIENAFKCGLFDQVVVSTDDDDVHRAVAKMGVLVTRREADDGATGTQELAGAYLRTRPDVGVCCVVYATAPLLTWLDLAYGWRTWHAQQSVYAYSVHRDTREDIGGYYWGFAEAFREGLPLLKYADGVQTPPIKCCDINVEADWLRAEQMYQALHEEKA